MQKIDLPLDYVIVLQQVNEYGEEDFLNLVESLQFDQGRLGHIIQALQHKRLVRVTKSGYTSWIRLSARGKRFMNNIWPESGFRTPLSRF